MADSEQQKSEAGEPTFEASLTELQEVVRTLEEGALGLDESIARFERGITLLRRCFQSLERAEQKIELLTGFDRTGNPITAPFDSAATLDAAQAAPGKRSNKTKHKKSEPDPEPDASIPEAESPAAKEGGSSRPLF